MKILLLFILPLALLYPVDQQRIKLIRLLTPPGKLMKTIRFNYDAAGNMTRIAQFDSKGNLDITEYFFRNDRCLAYRKQFNSGKLQYLYRNYAGYGCVTSYEEKLNANGQLLTTTQYSRRDWDVESFTVTAPNGEQLAQGRTEFMNRLLSKVHISRPKVTQHLIYSYDAQGRLVRIEENIIMGKTKTYSMQALTTYEDGPITAESQAYFFQ
jgi:hypothetical protein